MLKVILIFFTVLIYSQENQKVLVDKVFSVNVGSMCEETTGYSPCAGQQIYVVLEFKKDIVSIIEKYVDSCDKVSKIAMGDFNWSINNENEVQIGTTSEKLKGTFLEGFNLAISKGQLIGKNNKSIYKFKEIKI